VSLLLGQFLEALAYPAAGAGAVAGALLLFDKSVRRPRGRRP
jgi:hypothetical protein